MHHTIFTPNQRLIAIFIVVAVLLSIPLIAMRFTNEVKWTGFDFLAAGFMLLTTGLLCEFVWRKVRSLGGRLILCGAILCGLALMWGVLALSD
jgi:hypothetical protein